jgi:hypothetical protein
MSDEIVRLSTGCIRWQQEDVMVPETGEVLPKEVTCFLTVPVNKTTGTFQKPVNPMVGKRINEWEQARASGQPEESDRKTGAMVNYLFSHRGQVGKKYLNDALIPAISRSARPWRSVLCQGVEWGSMTKETESQWACNR